VLTNVLHARVLRADVPIQTIETGRAAARQRLKQTLTRITTILGAGIPIEASATRTTTTVCTTRQSLTVGDTGMRAGDAQHKTRWAAKKEFLDDHMIGFSGDRIEHSFGATRLTGGGITSASRAGRQDADFEGLRPLQ